MSVLAEPHAPRRLAQREVVGRSAELDAIAGFLEAEGPHTLVLEGEAGIGKSTLWLAGVDMARARGHEVLRARPASVESSLSLAGLRDLLAAVPRDLREQLPDIQQRAVAVALAEDDAGSAAVEAGVLGVAVLGLVRELAVERPVLLAIDDLQWLDESSAALVVYVLRRLGDANVRLVTTCRADPGAPLPLGLERALEERSLTRLALEPLSEGALRRLLRLRLGLSVTRAQLHALHSATRGNPMFALELARSGLVVDETGALYVPSSVHDLVGARLEMLPAATRDALAFVAALGDPREAVLERVGVREALGPALDAEVVELTEGRVRFAHPLVGATAWSTTGSERRSEVHRVLADAVDDLEERARQLAATTEPPDPNAADVLAQAAELAHRRGAPAGAASLLDRALELTPADAPEHWERLAVRAAAAHAEAGHWDDVWALVSTAQDRLAPGPGRAAILVTATQMRPGLEDVLRQAVDEAGETPIGVQARIGVAAQATFAGRWRESVDAASDAVALARRLGDRGLLGLALSYLGGVKLLDSQVDGTTEITEALAIEQELGALPTSVFLSPRMWQAVSLAFRDDHSAARPLLEERTARAFERGDDLSAFQSLLLLIHSELRAGEWPAARNTGRRALDLAEAFGYAYERPILLGALAALESCEGDLERAREHGQEALSVLTELGDRLWSTFALASLLFAELCAGDTAAAVIHADAIGERFPDGRECWWSYHQGDEIEALVRAGEHERARERIESVRVAGHELALPRFVAWAARGDGLLLASGDDLEEAERALEGALSAHECFTFPLERARTLLAYGHVLRRRSRRRAARTALGEALGEFERLGARHFVEAARDELKHVGGRPAAGEHELTGAEERVARLVGSGLSNREVAEQLFLAVSTVEATLTHVYRKLGLTSRTQLARALVSRDEDP